MGCLRNECIFSFGVNKAENVYTKVAVIMLYARWRIQDDESVFVFEQGAESIGGVGTYDAIVAAGVDPREAVEIIRGIRGDRRSEYDGGQLHLAKECGDG